MQKQYRTKQRALVYGLLKNNGGCMGAQELYRALAASGESVGMTTVYRTLDALCESGDARRFDDPGGALYMACGEHCPLDEHIHLKCTDCGGIIHLGCGFVGQLREHLAADHGFSLDTGRTVIYGLCSECLKKKEENQ